MRKPKLTVLIFTYRGDEGLTPICVEFIKETLGSDTKIVVADDGLNAMFKETRDKLISMGVDYRQTTWPRNGNLLGPDHLIGATALMAELAKDCDIIVKIDPDACVLKRDWIDRLWLDSDAIITSAYKTKVDYPMGNSYAVKASVCEALAKDAKLYPAWVDCFEDYEVGVRVSRIANGDPKHAIRYTCNLAGGFVLTNPWDINHKTCIESIQVYCSGFQYGSTPQNKKAEYKNKQIEVHTILLSELKKSKGVMTPISEQAVPTNIGSSPLNNGNFPELPNVSVPTGPTGGNAQYMESVTDEQLSEDVQILPDVKDSDAGIAINSLIVGDLVKSQPQVKEQESDGIQIPILSEKVGILPEFLEEYKNA